MSLNPDQLASMRMYLNDQGSSSWQNILLTNALSGTFTITYNGQTTGAIPYGSGANVLQNSLAGLSTVGLGNVSVSNLAPYDVYFIGTLGETAVYMLTVNTSGLVGTSVTATVSEVIAGGVVAFSDLELSSIYDNDANQNFFLAVSLGYRVLQGNAVKFNDYTYGQTVEKKSQVREGLKELADYYEQWAFSADQVQLSTLAGVPARLTAVPRTAGVPATSLSYAPFGPWGPYGPIGPWGRGYNR